MKICVCDIIVRFLFYFVALGVADEGKDSAQIVPTPGLILGFGVAVHIECKTNSQILLFVPSE